MKAPNSGRAAEEFSRTRLSQSLLLGCVLLAAAAKSAAHSAKS
jgi:hypothetical protein